MRHVDLAEDLPPPPRRTGDMALKPGWVFNVPSERKDNVEQDNQGGHEKTKEPANKRLADRNSKGDGPRITLLRDPELQSG